MICGVNLMELIRIGLFSYREVIGMLINKLKSEGKVRNNMKDYFYYIEAKSAGLTFYLATDERGHLYWSKSIVNVKRFKIRHSALKFINQLFSEVKYYIGNLFCNKELKSENPPKLLIRLIKKLPLTDDIRFSVVFHDVHNEDGYSIKLDMYKVYKQI